MRAGPTTEELAHRPVGRQQGKAEGREGKQTKGRVPRNHPPPQEGDKAMSLTR